MAKEPSRDEVIAEVIEVLEREMTADAVSHFLNAKAIVDRLQIVYKIRSKT